MLPRIFPKSWKPFHLAFLGMSVTLFALLLHGLRPPFLHKQELLFYDLLLRWTHDSERSALPVIVDLDEASLRKYGQWPWPRYRVAELLDRIASMEPRVVGLDMVFAEPDATSITQWKSALEREKNLSLQITGLPRELEDFDALLANSLAKGPFVLGYKFHMDPAEGGQSCKLHPVKVFQRHQPGIEEGVEALFQAHGAACNLPSFNQAAKASGFFNIVPDPDGLIRRMPMLIKFQEAYYPCLPLAMLMKDQKKRPIFLHMDANGPFEVQLGDNHIPVDRTGSALIHFRGLHGRYEYISAKSILQGSVEKERLKDRYVLIGTTTAGLRELRATPLDGAFQGVEVHATLLDNMLQGDFIKDAAWSWGALVILISGTLSSLVLSRFGAILSGALACLLALGVLMFSYNAMREGLFLQPLLPLLTIGGTFLFSTWWKSRVEEKTLTMRNQELMQTQDLTIHSMAALGEARDPETGAHLRRTQEYVRLLALKLKENPKFRKIITDEFVEAIHKMAPLHDIGKIGIPDRILLKPEGLTEEEYTTMKSHTLVAAQIFEEARRELGPNSFLIVGEQVCRSHHERWDGSGYPFGIKGEDIPLSARIMALADVFDAMVSQRVYKEAMDPEYVTERITQGSGTLFDPDVVEAFLRAKADFYRVVNKHGASSHPVVP